VIHILYVVQKHHNGGRVWVCFKDPWTAEFCYITLIPLHLYLI